MGKVQWLQATIPAENWQKLNGRRLNLRITWAALLEPDVNEYLDKLEAAKAPVTETTSTAKGKKKVVKGKGKKQPGNIALNLVDGNKEVIK